MKVSELHNLLEPRVKIPIESKLKEESSRPCKKKCGL